MIDCWKLPRGLSAFRGTGWVDEGDNRWNSLVSGDDALYLACMLGMEFSCDDVATNMALRTPGWSEPATTSFPSLSSMTRARLCAAPSPGLPPSKAMSWNLPGLTRPKSWR